MATYSINRQEGKRKKNALFELLYLEYILNIRKKPQFILPQSFRQLLLFLQQQKY